MQPKTFVTIGAFVGSTIGGYIPALWGGSVFSFSSLLLGAVGAVVGIWFGWQLSQRYL